MGPINIREVIRRHQRFLAIHHAMVEAEVERAGQAGERHVQTSPGFKPRTGALQRATRHRVIRHGKRALILSLQNPKKYAAAIDKGARPHVIVPRRKKFLRFVGKAGVVFTKRVNHPGNRPFHFLRNAANAAGEHLARGLRAGMRRAAQRF